MGEETVFSLLQEHVLGAVDVNQTWQPEMIFLYPLFTIGESMKITLLSPVQVSGMHCFQWRDKICISKFYAIHMTGYPFGQEWYRYQKGIKG